MKEVNPDLESCIRRLEQKAQEGIVDPGIEVYAVNHLLEKSDILDFYRAYVESMKHVIEKERDGGKRSDAVLLLKKGHPLEQVAEFFVHDGLMSTLGHIFNDSILDAWYSALPHVSTGYFEGMYKELLLK